MAEVGVPLTDPVRQRRSTRLRSLLAAPGPLVAPCAYDCVSARIIERAGFPLILHGGYNSAASLLGVPDLGLISMTEMIYAARNIAAAVSVPVLIDVDDGFGDVLNVARTTRESIRSGLAGLYIEDQNFPKRSPSIGPNQVIPISAMTAKIRTIAAVAGEEDSDFVVMARTHSSRVTGMAEAIERSLAYAEAGADIIFVDLGYSEAVVMEELELIAEQIVPRVMCAANMTENCGRPLLTTDELHRMGFKVILYPLTALMSATAALESTFNELAAEGTTRRVADRMWPPAAFKKLIGAEQLLKQKAELEKSE
jgi:2-methylisocitrate lyase-like PEP mutase family enzyme